MISSRGGRNAPHTSAIREQPTYYGRSTPPPGSGLTDSIELVTDDPKQRTSTPSAPVELRSIAGWCRAVVRAMSGDDVCVPHRRFLRDAVEGLWIGPGDPVLRAESGR